MVNIDFVANRCMIEYIVWDQRNVLEEARLNDPDGDTVEINDGNAFH